jgi:rubrerythrin
MKKNNRFSKGLNEAIRDERKAPTMYSKLRQSATPKGVRRQISGIIRDERRHGRILRRIRRLGGRG